MFCYWFTYFVVVVLLQTFKWHFRHMCIAVEYLFYFHKSLRTLSNYQVFSCASVVFFFFLSVQSCRSHLVSWAQSTLSFTLSTCSCEKIIGPNKMMMLHRWSDNVTSALTVILLVERTSRVAHSAWFWLFHSYSTLFFNLLFFGCGFTCKAI